MCLSQDEKQMMEIANENIRMSEPRERARQVRPFSRPYSMCIRSISCDH
jgi:hypothetical protein